MSRINPGKTDDMRQDHDNARSPIPGIPADGPFVGVEGHVGPDVIDVNGHMNVLGFDKLFDAAENALFLAFGMGEPYLERTGKSMFRLEKLIRYERELFADDAIEIRSYLMATDMKRIHHVHELWSRETGQRSAIFDALSIHVDLTARRSTPITDAAARQSIAACAALHAALPRPEGALDRGLGTKR